MKPNINRPLRGQSPSEVNLDLDYRIRMLALYAVSKGNTVIAPEMDIWKQFSFFKRQLQSGEWGAGPRAFDALEIHVMSLYSALPRSVNHNELELERVLRIPTK